jgi:hypothetical protein
MRRGIANDAHAFLYGTRSPARMGGILYWLLVLIAIVILIILVVYLAHII